MPNNQLVDFIVPHRHAADDVGGLGVVLFPPTLTALLETDTTGSASYADIEGGEILVTPPTSFPIWEARAFVSLSVGTDVDNAQVGIRLQQDGVTVPNSTRVVSTPGSSDLVSDNCTEATIYLDAGVEASITVQWASLTGGAGAGTAGGLMELRLRPYAPAAI